MWKLSNKGQLIVKEHSLKYVLAGVLMLFFGIVCLWETAACAKVFKDLGSEPVTITLENCHYEYRLHRPQGSGRLTGENDRRTYIFDVDGLDKKMLREINEQHGQCKVTYYENTRSVVSVEY